MKALNKIQRSSVRENNSLLIFCIPATEVFETKKEKFADISLMILLYSSFISPLEQERNSSSISFTLFKISLTEKIRILNVYGLLLIISTGM